MILKKIKIQKYISRSEVETIAIAKKIAKGLKPGSVIALSGDLGAGKTTMIKGLALGLGLKDQDEVKSPTFAIMHIYPARIPLHHYDLYRIESPKELDAIGFQEYISDPHTISCIEWADKFPKAIPPSALWIRMRVEGENERSIEVEFPPAN